MSALPWQLYTERMVGRNHPTLADTNNRALRQLLTESGYNPDADPFPGLMGPVQNVKARGAVGDGVTDDTTAVQAAITAAFNVPGGIVIVPPGTYKISSPLTTPSDTAGAIRILGMGRPKGFTGGVNGDASADQGATLAYSGTTGDIFSASLSSGNKRQYITIESITLKGNKASGTSGHGLHFQATATTTGILVCLRDVTVTDCKQHGIFFDGNVFESQFYNVRSLQNGDRGFKAAANGSTLPGETRLFGCTFNNNVVGFDAGGGGHFSCHGVTCTSNSSEAMILTSVHFDAVDLQFESNGTTTMTIDGASFNVRIMGILIVYGGGATTGISGTNSAQGVYINGLRTNSSGAINDVALASSCTRWTIDNYTPNDFTTRLALSTGGGHIVRLAGQQWLSGQAHGRQTFSVAGGGNLTPDLTQADHFEITATSAGTVTVNAPTVAVAYHRGQVITLVLINSSGGAVTFSLHSRFHTAGAIANPATGTRRAYTFVASDDGTYLTELARSGADIT